MSGSHVHAKAIANGIIVDVPSTGFNVYYGFGLRETAGATGVVRIRAGSVTGTILDTIAFAANQSVAAWYGPDGIHCDGDLYCEVASGTIEGSIRYG